MAISESMEKATIKTYPLIEGFELREHYYFSQYGEIDENDVRFSIAHRGEVYRHISINDKNTYEIAMVEFLVQMSIGFRKNGSEEISYAVQKLLGISEY